MPGAVEARILPARADTRQGTWRGREGREIVFSSSFYYPPLGSGDSPAHSHLPLRFSLQREKEIFKGEKARLSQSSCPVFARWSWDLIAQQR